MARLATAASVVALLGVLAAPALAQPVYPVQPGPVVNADVTVVTPRKTIHIEGDNWGPGTTVEVCTRTATEDCARDGAGATGTTSVIAAADGTISAEVTMPSEIAGERVTLVARGTDVTGHEVTQQLILPVETEAEGAAAAPVRSAGGVAGAAGDVGGVRAEAFLTLGNALLAAMVVAGALALLLGPVRRRHAR